jgi:hypothetical protein
MSRKFLSERWEIMTKLPNNKERHVLSAEHTLLEGDSSFTIKDGHLEITTTDTSGYTIVMQLDSLATLRIFNLLAVNAKAIHEQARLQQRKAEGRKAYAGRNHKDGNFSSG